MWRNLLKKITNLPLSKGDFGAFIPYIMAFLLFLSTLGLMVMQSAHEQVSKWENVLHQAVTLQIFAPKDVNFDPLEAYQTALNDKITRVSAFLKGRADVKSFELLEGQKTAALLKPWLGDMSEMTMLAAPTLMHIHPAHTDMQSLEHLSRTLSAEFEGVTLDYHNVWIENLVSAGKHFIQWMMIALAVLGALIALMVVFMTRIGFVLHRKNAEILSLMGGSAAYIRGQFLNYIIFRTLQGFAISMIMVAPLFIVPHTFEAFAPIKALPFLAALYGTVLLIVWLASFITASMNVKKLA